MISELKRNIRSAIGVLKFNLRESVLKNFTKTIVLCQWNREGHLPSLNFTLKTNSTIPVYHHNIVLFSTFLSLWKAHAFEVTCGYK